MNILPKPKSNSGQTLLVVVLVISVSLIIALSVISRTVTDVTVTNKEDESQRAFSAAEAGIEKSLLSGVAIPTTNLNNSASFTTQVTNFSQGTTSFVNPMSFYSGESMTLWFVSHSASGSTVCDGTHPCFTGDAFTVCWVKTESTPTDVNKIPALELSVHYETTAGDPSTLQIARATFDPNQSRGNGFAAVDAGTCSIGTPATLFAYKKAISLNTNLGLTSTITGTINKLQFARIRLLYNTDTPHLIGITGGSTAFPSQGVIIDSTGTSCTAAGSCGDSNRKITVVEGYKEIPSIFESAIFSPGGIIK